MSIKVGVAVVHGIHENIRPIINIPPDALKVRLRMRHNEIAQAFVKFSDRIERWRIMPADERTINHPQWKLGRLLGVNYRELSRK